MPLPYEEKLTEIAKQIKKGVKPQRVTARTFIGWFGAQRRYPNTVSMIRYGLKKYNLVTKPDFDSVYIDSLISLQSAPPEAYKDGQPTVTDLNADPTYRIGKLASANRRPISVKPDALLSEATTLMLAHDYSQLPVMTTERDVKGVISWTSIGSRLALGIQCEHVCDCMVPAHEVSAETYLFAAIDDIVRHQYALIRDSENLITGIVTTTDLGLQFRQLGEPFLILGEIENYLRRMIQDKYTIDELKEICAPSDEGRDIQGVSDLTFGEYLRLLEKPERWNKLGLSISREPFIKQLDEIRQIRNDVMHFDPDGISEQDMETLRRFVRLMQELANMGVI